ncbi:MAG: hypothetical protein JSU85_01330 [Candidatus Zixiibacteriota bacterium]|nr:MAG: hypothetical protein JSU85_01330 [candidate division Zixibacteria bacterium]
MNIKMLKGFGLKSVLAVLVIILLISFTAMSRNPGETRVEIWGACCDDSTGECNENIEEQNCQGPNMRFMADGSCEDFSPPCGGCPEDLFEIHIMTDGDPSEITWELRDESGGVLASGGPYSNLPDTLIKNFICADSTGCYSFAIFDAWGDGIFPPGYFEIYLNDSLLIYNNTFCAESLIVSHLGSGCGPVLGACCDDTTADCNERIEEQNCQGSSMRFIADGRCEDFNPPCGGCLDYVITIEIMPDDYPSEITWGLFAGGTGYGVAYGGLDAYNTLYQYYYCAAPDSCYDFYIFDSEGDGICCGYGIGYYRIYLNGALVDSGGQYGVADTVAGIGDGCGSILGACCDDSSGICEENVLRDSCAGRFGAFSSCSELNPPCGGGGVECPEDELQVHILTDDYPDETTWILRNTAGANIASGGPYDNINTLYIDTVCVDSSECYTFIIYDEYGDGLIIPAYYELYLNSIVIESNHSFAGDSAFFSYVGNGCPAITGACCNDDLAECNENVERDSCQGPDVRFIIDGTCADFNPPCGGCPEDSIVIEIMTDNYPYETTWEILESGTSDVIGSGGPYNGRNMLFVEYICAENSGCYDFIIYDEYGDGICCDNGNGYYNVFLNDSLVATGGEFDFLEATAEIGYGCGGPGCDYVAGDVNGSGGYNGLDITYGVAFFKGGAAPLYECECTPGNIWYVSGDVNGSCNYNGLDITYGVAYFKGGADPMPCADCPPPELIRMQMIRDKLKDMTRDRSSKSKDRKLIK